MSVRVEHGDSRDVVKALDEASIDSCVCDPPYALVSIGKRFGADNAAPAKPGKSGAYARASAGFMGQKWDTGEVAFDPAFWADVLRVLKPGAHLLAFGGTRTYHRLAVAIEDAGFEIRDAIQWLYGSGFPKSHNVGKGIDKRRNDIPEVEAVRAWLNARRVERGLSLSDINERFGHASNGGGSASSWMTNPTSIQCPTWDQWLALKEMLGFANDMDAEVWRLNGRKGTPGEAWKNREFYDEPTGGLHGGTGNTVGAFTKGRQAKPGGATDAARQWEGWGTALKPACEIICVARKPLVGTVAANVLQHGTGALNIDACRVRVDEGDPNQRASSVPYDREGGAIMGGGMGGRPGLNLSPQGRWPANVVHDGSDEVVSGFPASAGAFAPVRGTEPSVPAKGDVAYGFRERVEHRHHGDSGSAARFFYTAKADAADRLGSKHPTVKPVDLMRWLVRLVTPPGGTVLDPFAGSGTTGMACLAESLNAVLIEREAAYVADIKRRIAHVSGQDAPLFATQTTGTAA